MFPYNHITIIVEGVAVNDAAPAPEVEPGEPEKPPARKRQRKTAEPKVVTEPEKNEPGPEESGSPAGGSETVGLDLDAMLAEARAAMGGK